MGDLQDDGVDIEVEGEDQIHPDKLQNQTPAAVANVFSNVTLFLQQYGWLIVIGLLLLLYLKNRFQKSLQRLQEKAQVSREKKYDPDVAQSRLEAMEAARRRLQEEHDAKAAFFAGQQKKKEEEKRKLKIEDWENHQQGKGYRSKIKPKEEEQNANTGFKKKPTLRENGYSPLMGDGGSSGYRPSRRGGAGGGG